MTAKADPVAASIDDARSFMDALLQSDWQQLHVARDDFELFIAREGGGPNPMFDVVEEAQPPEAATPGKITAVTAPHVATIAWVLQAGANVAAGEVLALISVLDEQAEIKADKAGRIASVDMEQGQLAEFGMTILQIAENP